MTSTTFFIIFIPILAVLLLAINLILAPHNPYQEKDSVFECGFHSFLGQNRTQFSVSFFIANLTKREYRILMILGVATVLLGIYTPSILESSLSTEFHNFDDITEFKPGGPSSKETLRDGSNDSDLPLQPSDHVGSWSRSSWGEEKNMPLHEKYVLLQQLVDKDKDKLIVLREEAALGVDNQAKVKIVNKALNKNSTQLDILKEQLFPSEFPGFRVVPTYPPRIAIDSLLDNNNMIFISTVRFSVSLYVKNIVMYLRPLFSIIASGLTPIIFLSFLFFFDLHIIYFYNMLIDILGEWAKCFITILFSIVLVFFKILLAMYKANKYSDQYDKLFNFLRKNYFFAILYFFVVFVALFYFCF